MGLVSVNIPVLGDKGSAPANAIASSVTDLAAELNGGLDNTNLRARGVTSLEWFDRVVNVQSIPVNLTVFTGGLHFEPDFVKAGSSVATVTLPSVSGSQMLLVSVQVSWVKYPQGYEAEMFPVVALPGGVLWTFTRTKGLSGNYAVGFDGVGVENGLPGQMILTRFAGQQMDLRIGTEKQTFPSGFVVFPEWDQFRVGTVTVTTEILGF